MRLGFEKVSRCLRFLDHVFRSQVLQPIEAEFHCSSSGDTVEDGETSERELPQKSTENAKARAAESWDVSSRRGARRVLEKIVSVHEVGVESAGTKRPIVYAKAANRPMPANFPLPMQMGPGTSMGVPLASFQMRRT